MAMQIVDGREVFVVDLKEIPELPIRWENEEEKPYARVLAMAIMSGVIVFPGKYALEVTGSHWNVWNVEE